jgi:hypothetical protein
MATLSALSSDQEVLLRSAYVRLPLVCCSIVSEDVASAVTMSVVQGLRADVNKVDRSGRTPLHIALASGRLGDLKAHHHHIVIPNAMYPPFPSLRSFSAVARALLESGANPMSIDENGRSALHVAAHACRSWHGLAKSLLSAQALTEALLQPTSPESIFFCALCATYGRQVSFGSEAVWTIRTALTQSRDSSGVSVIDILRDVESESGTNSWGLLQLACNSDALDRCLAYQSRDYVETRSLSDTDVELLARLVAQETRYAAVLQSGMTDAAGLKELWPSNQWILIIPTFDLAQNHSSLWKRCSLSVSTPRLPLQLLFVSAP